jgi:multidrug efflux pump subunit AcrA (membrane-fusion protein)
MSQNKVVARTTAIGLGVLCIVILMGAVGAVIYYNQILNDKNSAYDTLASDNSAYVNNHSHTNTDWESLKAQLTAAQNQLSTSNSDSTVSNLQSQIDSLQSQLNTANSNLQSKQSQLDTANTQITSLNSQIATLNSQITSLKAAQLIKVNFQYADSHPFLSSSSSVTVSGAVLNSGTNTANNVVLTVQIYGANNNLLGSGTISLGTIAGKSYQNFQQSFSYTGTTAYSHIDTPLTST